MFFLFIFCFDEAVSPALVEEAIVADTSNITGDRGNPSYIKQLNQLNENTQNQGNPPKHTNSNLYHPQRSYGKVMFSQASVILFTVGGACMAEGHA